MFYSTELVLEHISNNSNQAESSVRSIIQATCTKNRDGYTKVKPRHFCKHRMEGEVGLNTQGAKQEPSDAGETHEGN